MNQLRQALDIIDRYEFTWLEDDEFEGSNADRLVCAAARSWLSLLEADEAIVEKVAARLKGADLDPWQRNDHKHLARLALAAIVGEET